MVGVAEFALRFLRLYGPLALCLFTFLEASMLFPFLPSEVVAPAAAALLITDPASFLIFLLAAGVGGTSGAFVPFTVFHRTRVGETSWLRDYLRISDERIEQGEAWYQCWGQSSVLWERFLPVLRSVVSIPAGLADMKPMRFGVYTAAGTGGFYAASGAVVYYGRQQSVYDVALTAATDRPGLTIGVLLTLLSVGLFLWRWYHRWHMTE